MSVKEDLLRQLSEQKDLSKLKSPEIVTEWRNSLRRLFDQFKMWLTEKSAKDVLRVVETSDRIKERLLEPEYLIPILRIEAPNGDVVQIVPKARIVAGAYGRVDFECGAMRNPHTQRFLIAGNLLSWRPDQGGWSFPRPDRIVFLEGPPISLVLRLRKSAQADRLCHRNRLIYSRYYRRCLEALDALKRAVSPSLRVGALERTSQFPGMTSDEFDVCLSSCEGSWTTRSS